MTGSTGARRLPVRASAGGPALLVLLALLPVWVTAVLVGAPWQAGEPVGGETSSPGSVVVVGVPGLTWDLIGTSTTPTMARLADRSAVGALVVRGADPVTCTSAGWLTLGAGQRAGTDPPCSAVDVEGAGEADGGADQAGTARVPSMARLQALADDRPLNARLGTLAAALGETGVCVSAHGAGAALAAADPQGSVARYASTGLLDQPRLDPDCTVHLVGSALVAENDRAETLGAVDAALGDLLQRLPSGSTLVLAGLSDSNARPELHAVMVASPGDPAPGQEALLTSSSTRQPGLVQTTDLTATVLTVAGARVPGAVAGSAVTALPTQARALTEVGRLAQAGSLATALMPWVLGTVAALLLPVLALAAVRRWWIVVGVLGTAMVAVLPATFLAGLQPWWSAGQPFFAVTGATLLWTLVLVGVAWAGPWRRHPLGPPGVVCALTVAVIGTDVVAGGRLGLISVLGVQPVSAGRFYGMGNVGFGIVAGAALVLSGVVAALELAAERRRQAVLGVLLIGATAVAVDGVPAWGADFGGVPALALGVGLLAVVTAGLRLTPVRLLGLAVLAVALGAGIMVADWLRPAQQRTHLGDFVGAVLDGSAGSVVARKLDQSLGILLHYPASWLAVLAVAVLAIALAAPDARPGRWLTPLWQWPVLRACAWSVLVTAVLAWAMNDSGVAAAATLLTVAVGTGVAISAALANHDGPARRPRRAAAWPGAAARASPGP